eukprot:15312080-Alexandrium_andersonii.AAC.1
MERKHDSEIKNTACSSNFDSSERAVLATLRSSSGAPAGPPHPQIRHLHEQRRRTQPLGTSGSDPDAVSGPERFKLP